MLANRHRLVLLRGLKETSPSQVERSRKRKNGGEARLSRNLEFNNRIHAPPPNMQDLHASSNVHGLSKLTIVCMLAYSRAINERMQVMSKLNILMSLYTTSSTSTTTTSELVANDQQCRKLILVAIFDIEC